MKKYSYNKNDKFLPNPFSPQHPATPEYFADRSDTLDYFRRNVLGFAKLKKAKPINYAVLGEWGVGKTSLLQKFQDTLINELSGRLNAFSSFLVLTPEYCADLSRFFQVLLQQIKDDHVSTSKVRSKIRSELKKWKFSIGIAGAEITAERTPEVSAPNFTRDLEKLWRGTLAPSGVDAAFIFLDDIHHFLPSQPGALDTLRNVFQSLAIRGCKYSLIISGPKILFTYAADTAEPFTRFFYPFYIQNLSLAGTRELIELPIKLSDIKLRIEDEVFEQVHRMTTGHPYFVVYTMFELLNNLRADQSTVTRKIFDSIWPKIVESLEVGKFKSDFESASEKEKEVLLGVAQLSKDTAAPSDVKGVKGSPVLFRRLERKGIFVKTERAKYRIYHPLFREFLKRSKAT